MDISKIKFQKQIIDYDYRPDVIFGMPFLKENELLIDVVARKLIPRSSIAQEVPPCLSKYVKVGNTVMELPTPEPQSEEIKSLVEERPEYASLNDFFRKEFPEVFS